MPTMSRREVLRRVVAGGAGFALMPKALWGQDASITIAGRPVQIAVSSVSASTLRISVQPVLGGAAQETVNRGPLVAAAAGRSAGRWRNAFNPVRAGDLSVRFVPGPLADRW